MRRPGQFPVRRITRARAFILAWIASLATLHCTSASTSLTSPTAGKCRTAITTGQSSFGPGGGQSSVTITTPRDCSWSVSAEAPWISISGNRNGQGDAQVPFSVAVNPAPSARSAAISVGSERIELNQAPAPCTFQLSRTADSINSGGGRLSVTVTTLAGCAWSASSAAAWIAIESGASGSSSGTVALVVTANTGTARAGTVTIAGQTYTVSQSAAPGPSPAPPTPPPASPTPPPPTTSTPVTFEGNVSSLMGICPFIAFSAAGYPVVADAKTEFEHGKCTDLSNGDKVRVRGIRQPTGIVAADRIEFR